MDYGDYDFGSSILAAIKNDSLGFEAGCPPKHYLAAIALIVIASVGIIANAVAIFIILILKEYMQSVSKIYVLQLAFADFFFLFLAFFQAQTFMSGEWTYGSVWCKISEAAKMLNYYSSVGFLTLMALDRCLAINLAMNHRVRRFRTKKSACIASACIWCVVILSVTNILTYADVHQCECAIYFPANEPSSVGGNNSLEENFDVGGYDTLDILDRLVDVTKKGNETWDGKTSLEIEESILSKLQKEIGDLSCSLHMDHVSDYFKTWVVCNFLFAFLLPYVIMFISCALTLRRIKRPMSIGTTRRTENPITRRVTRMVIGLAIAFIICWLPYHAFNLARLGGIRLQAATCDSIINFTIALAYSNSAINPIFYIFLSTTFRERLHNALNEARTRTGQCIATVHHTVRK